MAISSFNEHLRRIVLSGDITEDTAAHFLEQLTALEYIDHSKPITLYIDTYGGSLDAALLIYDAMCTCSCPINTVGIGKIMSAGVLILAAGDKGYRFISPNARVMIHEVSGGSRGTVSDMEVSVTEMRRMQDTYVRIVAKHTGQKKKTLEDDTKGTDKHLSANEAIKYGIADRVFPSRRTSPRKAPAKKKVAKKSTKKKVAKKSTK